MLKFYVIDTETIGLKPGYHELNQISILRCEDKFQKTFNIKVKHPERASKDALRIQNKTVSDLLRGIDALEAIEEIEEFIFEDGKRPEHRCIVAHNAPFDKNHLHALWSSANKRFPADLWLCTIAFSRKLAKKQGIVKPKLNLDGALKIAGVQAKPGAHSAAIDVWNTHALWEKLMSENLGHVSIIKNSPHTAQKKDNQPSDEIDMGVFDE